jgi:ribonuclease HII
VVLLDGAHNWLAAPESLFELATEESSSFCAQPDAESQNLGAGSARISCPPRVVTRIKADASCSSVAAASVLAKVERDALLVALAAEYPEYGFDRHKGYGAPEHLAALREYGPSEVHRKSWRLPTPEFPREHLQ